MKFFSLRSHISSPFYILFGLALLPGRYKWTVPTRSASWRGFLCSAFFFCILIPLISEILERSELRAVLRNVLLAAVTLLFALPYYWLGFDRFFYRRNGPDWFDWKSSGQPPHLVWFPRALWEPPLIPGELMFFSFLTATLLIGAWFFLGAQRRVGRPIARSTIMLGVAAIILIVTETWMHISLRSPYTYIPHFEQPGSASYWYHVNLFANGQGAVNADYFVFQALEKVFMGTPGLFNGMLIRRPFPFYLSSQFSAFFNPYWAMLCLNVGVWIGAVMAAREYLAAHFGRAQALIAALLVASGPGFIMYVAQPQTYLWGYCAVILTIWAHWRVCGNPHAAMRDYIFFGGILALALLTYDLLTLLLYLAGYEILFKRRLWPIVVSAGVAIVIYLAFGQLTTPMTSFIHDSGNSKYVGISLINAIAAIRVSPLALKNYVLDGGLPSNYIWNLSNAFFVFPLFVAVIGLFGLASPVRLKLVGLLLLPSLVSTAFLYLGQTTLAMLPRFTFVAFPAVYILCGVALWNAARKIGLRWAASRWRHAAAAVALCGIALHIVLVNADVFGHPWLYYLFYYQQLNPAHF
jgi:hypothetical protein